ncbi:MULTISPECIES: TetR family transcriptional regulator [unclassified Clostridium]|uniref:TetR family transcriptional regulator n=1 Tax=unclassified Clostridium TaxID=2614128 RepID=UPI0002985586|nr:MULTISPECIES: TetR family transcriptional regulator [unclassified Clostridium]EKQ57122.1 MAG: transcriptional regulator [Clostridium sp. Maddingley MBC34-26]
MNFQRARTEHQIASRQEEIIQACYTLYKTKDFEEVNLKAISEMTSISRPTIYNYYKTKEEILLDLLKREYLNWHETLNNFFAQNNILSKEEYCHFLADSLSERENFLKLLSVHYTSIEKNCSLEKLTNFKEEVHPLFLTLQASIKKFFPSASNEANDNFRFLFFSLIHGLYPMTHLTFNQLEAMKTAYPEYTVPNFKEKCYQALLLLTANL